MVEVRGLFLGEGKTDEMLARPLEDLLVLRGASLARVRTVPWGSLRESPGRTVSDQVRVGLELFPDTNLIFIHRDADSPDPLPRRAAVDSDYAATSTDASMVKVVPVQELEAWLLVDAEAIHSALGLSRKDEPPSVHSPERVEQVANPKEVLKELVERLQRTRSRRHRIRFNDVREVLLEQIDLTSPLLFRVPAVADLHADVERAVAALSNLAMD